MSLLDRDDVLEPKSRASTRPTDSPRVAASSATPAPTTPPPTTRTWCSVPVSAASADCPVASSQPRRRTGPSHHDQNATVRPDPPRRPAALPRAQGPRRRLVSPRQRAAPPTGLRSEGARDRATREGGRSSGPAAQKQHSGAKQHGAKVASGGARCHHHLDPLEFLEVRVARVAMVLRSAPIRFIDPSALVDGPCRICSSVPIVPTSTRVPAAGRGDAPRCPSGSRGRAPGRRERTASRPSPRRTERQGLRDVAAAGHPAVRDHVHVAAAGFVEVVASGGGDVGDRGGGRHRHAEHRCRGVTRTRRRTRPEPQPPRSASGAAPRCRWRSRPRSPGCRARR